MENNIAKIQILKNGDTIEVSTFMPIWQRKSEDGQIYISIPLLGIETISNDEDDIDKFIKEALTCFCVIAEKYGKGLKKELEALGWNLEISSINKKINSQLLNVKPKTPIYAEMLKTGSSRVYQFQI